MDSLSEDRIGKVVCVGHEKKMVLSATEAEEDENEDLSSWIKWGLGGLERQAERFSINAWTIGQCCKILRMQCREGNDSGRQIRGLLDKVN